MTDRGTDGSARRRGVLMVNYLFPPIGGAGVQRNLKFTKYLGEVGWDPTVLTVRNVNHYTFDRSLMDEVPASVRVVRTESLDPLRVSRALVRAEQPRSRESSGGSSRRSLLSEGSPLVQLYRTVRDVAAFPDGQAGWIPFAVRAGLQVISEGGIDAIMGCPHPLSTAVVAAILARRTGLPYLLDFRDGWLDDPYLSRPTPAHLAAHRRAEAWTVGHADAVTVYGDPLAEAFVQRYPAIEGRVHTITNGFDPADLEGIEPMPRTPGRARLVYSGSLYVHHEPNLDAFCRAVSSAPAEFRDRLEIVFVGQNYDGSAELVDRHGIGDMVTFLGYRSHYEALRYLASADAALLFIRVGDTSSITGKVFEYIGLNVPILGALEAHGACGGVLSQADRADWIAAPNDAAAIAAVLGRLDQAGWPRPDSEGALAFSRRRHTEILAAVLDKMCAARVGNARP